MMKVQQQDTTQLDIMTELQKESAKVLEGATMLRDALKSDLIDAPGLRARIKQVEHEADEIAHGVFEALNRTFIPPLDREDVISLTGKLDSVLDMVYASVLRMHLYKINRSTRPMLELAEAIHGSTVQLDNALRTLRDPSHLESVEAATIEVNRLENTADDVMNNAIAGLFESNNPVEILKLKEIYEKMEEATDYCEDVADTIRDIVAKNR